VAHQLGLHELVRVRFVIENDGHVSTATAIVIKGSAEAVPCVLKAVQALKFPAFTGDKITVVYPVTLAR
jgi:hypothetical protein